MKTMKSSLPQYWEHFNLPHGTIENDVKIREGSYQGLFREALYTSREDFLTIFNHPLVQGTFVDLGCGAGEGCLLYGSLYPDRKSIGVEFEEARLNYGRGFRDQFNLLNVELLKADLLTSAIPTGDTYFLYFPTGMVLDRILSELYHSQIFFHLVVIESHGDLYSRLDLENWLTLRSELPLKSARHHSQARIYERNKLLRDTTLSAFDLSFEHKYLFIQDRDEVWIGESRGLTWTRDDQFELLTPPRTVFWRNVNKWSDLAKLSPLQKLAVELRKEGELEFTGTDFKISGFIRKIIIHPTFRLEISTGEKVEWEKILTINKGSRLCYASSQSF